MIFCFNNFAYNLINGALARESIRSFSLNEDEFERYFNPNEEYHSLDYVPFMGFELEFNTVHHDIGRRSNLIDLIQKSNNIFGNNTFIYYMRDGSIGYGLEMISQPATYEFYLAHKDLLKQNFENKTIRRFG